MAYVNEFFSANLNARLEATDIYLPVSPAATADLLSLLDTPEAYTYLTIKGEVHFETVRVRNESGTLILERGLEGTEAVLHHYGSCVSTVSPTILAALKDISCNYNCCEDGDCPCEPVAYSGAMLPIAHVGVEWNGSVVFAGDAPINAAIDNQPAWMTATQQGNLIQLTGTPTTTGEVTISAAATNCNGTQLATKSLTITVTS